VSWNAEHQLGINIPYFIAIMGNRKQNYYTLYVITRQSED